MKKYKIQKIGTTVYGKTKVLCVFYYVYKSNPRRRAGNRIFLQKYNHLQHLDAADFWHGGHNY